MAILLAALLLVDTHSEVPRAWATACCAAKAAFFDLRHLRATAGGASAQLARVMFGLLGRSSLSQTQVFAALRPSSSSETPSAGLLHTSASMIRSWCHVDAESRRFLKGRNFVDLVLLLSGSGPQLVLKQHTQGARRFNKMLYYDSSFASLLVAKALRNQGKVQGTFHEVEAEWVCRGSQCVFLGTRRRQVREELVEEVLHLPEIASLRAELIRQATIHKEWVVCSHDATYQTLFTVIGQERMAQKVGEAHALHTIVGRTGCVPGFSVQRTESSSCFSAAMEEILPADARQSCLYMFSDSPSSIARAGDVLPSLLGVAEDALHLVLRLEACTGEKRTGMSAHVLRMQLKFRQPLAGELYKGNRQGDALICEGAWRDISIDREWAEYGLLPYTTHQDYLDDLSTVCHLFPEHVRRQDHKARTVRQILEAGGAYSHFRYLVNGSHIIWHLGRLFKPSEMELLSWGTCANEALHFQLKHAQQSIVQQHLEQVPVKLAAFSLGKLLCHNAAAYHPTLAQRSSAEVLALLEGRLRLGLVSDEPKALASVRSISELRQPVHKLDTAKCQRRAVVAKVQQGRWEKEQRKREVKAAKRVVPKPTLKTMKRTIFTQRKSLGCIALAIADFGSWRARRG